LIKERRRKEKPGKKVQMTGYGKSVSVASNARGKNGVAREWKKKKIQRGFGGKEIKLGGIYLQKQGKKITTKYK